MKYIFSPLLWEQYSYSNIQLKPPKIRSNTSLYFEILAPTRGRHGALNCQGYLTIDKSKAQ